MRVSVCDIGSNNRSDLEVARLTLSPRMRAGLVAIWDGACGKLNGLTVNLEGPFVIASAGVNEETAWSWLLVRSRNDLC